MNCPYSPYWTIRQPYVTLYSGGGFRLESKLLGYFSFCLCILASSTALSARRFPGNRRCEIRIDPLVERAVSLLAKKILIAIVEQGAPVFCLLRVCPWSPMQTTPDLSSHPVINQLSSSYACFYRERVVKLIFGRIGIEKWTWRNQRNSRMSIKRQPVLLS